MFKLNRFFELLHLQDTKYKNPTSEIKTIGANNLNQPMLNAS